MITLQLNGLHCSHCVNSVEKALNALPSVTHVEVNLTTQTALVESKEPIQTLIETIEALGFEVKLAT